MKTPASSRDRWAQLRFLIIGRLFAAPPEPGDLFNCLTELANKAWRHPVTGEQIVSAPSSRCFRGLSIS